MEPETTGTRAQLYRGEPWAFQVGPTVPATNFATQIVTLYLDPPPGVNAARIKLTTGDGSTTLGAGNASIVFAKNQAWSASLVPGFWTLIVCFGPASAPNEIATYKLPVVNAPKGALS